MSVELIEKYTPQIGELLQHHVTHDPNLLQTSDWYYGFVKSVLHRNPAIIQRKPRRYLEIASYRHILGYRLAKDYGFEPTQFDICDRDLEIGRELAMANGFPDAVDRVTGDFHDLPFSDNRFDLVFISASIHHTRTPHTIIQEAMRVLTDGGLFYCQREPCERNFCFYQFNANRASLFTPFERAIHERDMMRIISSPYPGARNAELFGRIENDRIPLDMYYATFAKYGTIIEEVVYFDGLLTRPDRLILEQAHLPEPQLAAFIEDLLSREMEIVGAAYTDQDRYLGYSLPSAADITAMAKRIAAALKSRPTDTSSPQYNRAMAKIFGGSLRFVVRRDRKEKLPSKQKFRRSVSHNGGQVFMDDAIYKNSGLRFWDRLLPDISTATVADIHDKAFPASDWTYFKPENQHPMMMAARSEAEIRPVLDQDSLVVARYRVIVDERMPWAKLRIKHGDELVEEVIVAQSEDRVLRLVSKAPHRPLRFEIVGMDGQMVNAAGRLRVPILQAIPITAGEDAAQATPTLAG